jgi:hypothetical protein
MTRRPFDPRETDTGDSGLDPVARELEAYADLTASEMPHGLADRVMTALVDEPTPRREFLAWMLGTAAVGRGAPRFLLVGATMALGILAVVIAGQFSGLFPDDRLGQSPSPSAVERPSVSPSPRLTPSPTPTVSPTPTPRETESSRPPASETSTPSASDDEFETPEADGTAEPSDDDHSGPGGGDDDSETPKPSDDDGSG